MHRVGVGRSTAEHSRGSPRVCGCPLAAAQADTRQGKSCTPRTGGSIVWAAVWWEEWQQWETAWKSGLGEMPFREGRCTKWSNV